MEKRAVVRRMDREIFRLAIPSMLANITIPLVGLVDTAVAGHIPDTDAAINIGAISIGSMIFSLMYWGFSFFRTGTGGLTAQAFGRKDPTECSVLLIRNLMLALSFSFLLLCISKPFSSLAIRLSQASVQVDSAALRYFAIRVWAAPATLTLMVFRGWFIGMQDSLSSMWTDMVVNVVNIIASVILSFGIPSLGWRGIGFDGVAAGTLIAQYSGLLFCVIVCLTKKYRRFIRLCNEDGFRRRMSDLKSMGQIFKLNADLFIRSVAFMVIYLGYTLIASRYGDLMLSVSSIMMQLMMLFSYLTDGFAYSGEALTGRFKGSGNILLIRLCTGRVFLWSMATSVLFMVIYAFMATPLLGVLTSDGEIINSCRQFYPWLILMPPLGCAAFTWDGIYQGATASAGVRNAMIGSSAVCALVWWILSRSFGVAVCTDALVQGPLAMHLLFTAYFTHLIYRAVYLGLNYKKQILSAL